MAIVVTPRRNRRHRLGVPPAAPANDLIQRRSPGSRAERQRRDPDPAQSRMPCQAADWAPGTAA